LIRYLSIGNAEALLVNSPQGFKDVLQTHCYSFVKPLVMQRVVGEIVGKGLLFAEGEDHKKQRRLLTGMWIRVSRGPECLNHI
jgi:cytochrome P450